MSCKSKEIGNLVGMQKESWHQLEIYVLKVDRIAVLLEYY